MSLLAARRVAPIPARSSTSPVSEMEPGTRSKKSPNRGRESFTPVVRLKSHRPCNHKHHYRNCYREVIGLYDLLASRDPERFVFISMAGVVKFCNRRKGKIPYKTRQVEYVSKITSPRKWFSSGRRGSGSARGG